MTIKHRRKNRVPWAALWLVGLQGLLAGAVPEDARGAEKEGKTGERKVLPDPRGPAELTICSQNLQNYGSYDDVKRREGVSLGVYRKKEQELIRRFLAVGCEVIAVQELLGSREEVSKNALAGLARALAAKTGRSYEVAVGASNDPQIRQGYIVARDRAEIINVVSYARAELPKISPDQKQRFFSRGPLELQIRVKPMEDSAPKTVSLINFHFKSRSSRGGRDPSGLEFEPYRMEMAEALRRIVDVRHKQSRASADTILVMLGDRNDNFDTASARILEGALTLDLFTGAGVCRLSKRGVPLCKKGSALSPRYFSVLTTDPQTKNARGTIRYDDLYSWIDDILLPAESLPFAWHSYAKAGDYDSGVVYEPKEASDHALVWVRLNW